MKRSIMRAGSALGSVMLLALGAACSHESRPTETPGITTTAQPEATVGSTAPSAAPQGTAPEGNGTLTQPGMQPGTQPSARPGPELGTVGPEVPSTEPNAAPAPPAPQAEVAPPAAAPNAPGTPTEQALCHALSSSARLHVEDVQHGAVIVAAPKAGSNLATLHEDAKTIEGVIRQGAPSGAAADTACPLFTLARNPNVTTSVIEGGNSVRMVMTTSDPAMVRQLRQKTRDLVGMLAHPSWSRGKR